MTIDVRERGNLLSDFLSLPAHDPQTIMFRCTGLPAAAQRNKDDIANQISEMRSPDIPAPSEEYVTLTTSVLSRLDIDFTAAMIVLDSLVTSDKLRETNQAIKTIKKEFSRKDIRPQAFIAIADALGMDFGATSFTVTNPEAKQYSFTISYKNEGIMYERTPEDCINLRGSGFAGYISLIAWILAQDTDVIVSPLPNYAPLMTPPSMDFFARILTTGGRPGTISSNGREKTTYSYDEKTDQVVFTRQCNGTTQELSILSPGVNLKSSMPVKTQKVIGYLLQVLQYQDFPDPLTIELKELVDLGMYSNEDNAARALDRILKQLRSFDIKESRTIKEKGKKVTQMIGGIMFYSRKRLSRNIFQIGVNRDFPWHAFSKNYTGFPRWGYRLDGYAYLLLYYFLFLARINPQDIATKNSYSIKILTAIDRLGLPHPSQVKHRKYAEQIKRPLLDAMEQINQASEADTTINGELKVILHTDEDAEINTWIKGSIELILTGEYIQNLVKLSTNQGLFLEAYKEEKLKASAKAKARSDVDEEQPKRKRGRPRTSNNK